MTSNCRSHRMRTQRDRKRTHLKGKKKSDSNVAEVKNLPLWRKSVYIDMKRGKPADLMEEHLVKLGARVETFLSADINYVISSFGPSKVEETYKCSDENPQSPLTSVASPFNCIPSPLGSGPSETKKSAVSRGKALAHLACSKKQTSTVVTNAEKMGVKVISVEVANKWMERELKKLASEEKKTECTAPNVTSPKKKTKSKVLKGCYIKFEASNRHYRPVKSQLEKWPKVNLLAPPGLSPFVESKVKAKHCFVTNKLHGRYQQTSNLKKADNVENVEKAKKLSPDEPHEDKSLVHYKQTQQELLATPITTAGDVKRNHTFKKNANINKQQGYCDCCEMKYKSLEKHLKGGEHQAFARDKSNYESLDTLISGVPSTIRFLQAVLLTHCIQKQREIIVDNPSATAGQTASVSPLPKRKVKDSIAATPHVSGVFEESAVVPLSLNTPQMCPEISPSRDQFLLATDTDLASQTDVSQAKETTIAISTSLVEKGKCSDEELDSRPQAVVIRRPVPSGIFTSPRRQRQPTPGKTPRVMERSMVFRDSPIASLQPSPSNSSPMHVSVANTNTSMGVSNSRNQSTSEKPLLNKAIDFTKVTPHQFAGDKDGKIVCQKAFNFETDDNEVQALKGKRSKVFSKTVVRRLSMETVSNVNTAEPVKSATLLKEERSTIETKPNKKRDSVTPDRDRMISNPLQKDEEENYGKPITSNKLRNVSPTKGSQLLKNKRSLESDNKLEEKASREVKAVKAEVKISFCSPLACIKESKNISNSNLISVENILAPQNIVLKDFSIDNTIIKTEGEIDSQEKNDKGNSPTKPDTFLSPDIRSDHNLQDPKEIIKGKNHLEPNSTGRATPSIKEAIDTSVVVAVELNSPRKILKSQKNNNLQRLSPEGFEMELKSDLKGLKKTRGGPRKSEKIEANKGISECEEPVVKSISQNFDSKSNADIAKGKLENQNKRLIFSSEAQEEHDINIKNVTEFPELIKETMLGQDPVDNNKSAVSVSKGFKKDVKKGKHARTINFHTKKRSVSTDDSDELLKHNGSSPPQKCKAHITKKMKLKKRHSSVLKNTTGNAQGGLLNHVLQDKDKSSSESINEAKTKFEEEPPALASSPRRPRFCKQFSYEGLYANNGLGLEDANTDFSSVIVANIADRVKSRVRSVSIHEHLHGNAEMEKDITSSLGSARKIIKARRLRLKKTAAKNSDAEDSASLNSDEHTDEKAGKDQSDIDQNLISFVPNIADCVKRRRSCTMFNHAGQYANSGESSDDEQQSFNISETKITDKGSGNKSSLSKKDILPVLTEEKKGNFSESGLNIEKRKGTLYEKHITDGCFQENAAIKDKFTRKESKENSTKIVSIASPSIENLSRMDNRKGIEAKQYTGQNVDQVSCVSAQVSAKGRKRNDVGKTSPAVVVRRRRNYASLPYLHKQRPDVDWGKSQEIGEISMEENGHRQDACQEDSTNSSHLHMPFAETKAQKHTPATLKGCDRTCKVGSNSNIVESRLDVKGFPGFNSPRLKLKLKRLPSHEGYSSTFEECPVDQHFDTDFHAFKKDHLESNKKNDASLVADKSHKKNVTPKKETDYSDKDSVDLLLPSPQQYSEGNQRRHSDFVDVKKKKGSLYSKRLHFSSVVEQSSKSVDLFKSKELPLKAKVSSPDFRKVKAKEKNQNVLAFEADPRKDCGLEAGFIGAKRPQTGKRKGSKRKRLSSPHNPTSFILNKKAKLRGKWQETSKEKMIEFLNNEQDSTTFHGFHESSDKDLPSNISTVNDSEAEPENCDGQKRVVNEKKRSILVDHKLEQDHEKSENYNEASEEHPLEDFLSLVPTFSSPGKATDSSWGDVCESYLSNSIGKHCTVDSPSRQSSHRATRGKQSLLSPNKTSVHHRRKICLEQNHPAFENCQLASPHKNISQSPDKKSPRVVPGNQTPSKRTSNQHQNQSPIIRVDKVISFNLMSPQKLKQNPL